MWEFRDCLLNAALPRIRDFNGVNPNSFDGRGNYSLGLREQMIFPEIEFDKIDKIRGMQITMITSARTDEEAERLLELLGMPFAKRENHQPKSNVGEDIQQEAEVCYPAAKPLSHLRAVSRLHWSFALCRICFRQNALLGQLARREEVELVSHVRI